MNNWQRNCYENWKRIKYKTDWNHVYWFTLWIIISSFYLVVNYNDFALIGYILLLNCCLWINEEDRLNG